MKHARGMCAVLILGSLLYATANVEAAEGGVFRGFTGHINQQIMVDKIQFAAAESCTQWFYNQLRKQRPSPQVELLSASAPTTDDERCLAQYPNGLEGARQAFSETQSSLSLSLTFYQFALVGDADDDGEYNQAELRDVFESFEMNFMTDIYPADYLVSLKHTFDTVRHTGQFSVLTTSMGRLYEKGYRFTSADQAALNQVIQ